MTSMTRSVRRPTQRNRIRPWVALRAFVKSARNPDDTENGARFVLALQGNRSEKTFQRFAEDPRGAEILAEGRQLIDRLRDRAGTSKPMCVCVYTNVVTELEYIDAQTDRRTARHVLRTG